MNKSFINKKFIGIFLPEQNRVLTPKLELSLVFYVIFDGKSCFNGRFTMLLLMVGRKGMIFCKGFRFVMFECFVCCVYDVVCSLRCALTKEGISTIVLLNIKWF